MNLLEEVQNQIEAGKAADALKKAKKAADANPDDLDAKRAVAHASHQLMVEAFDKGDLDGAIAHFSTYYALVLPEEDAELHEKFKFYQRRIHPEFAQMQEANKLSKAGKNLEALAIYEEVLKTLRDYKVAYVNVGWCLYRLLAELAPQDEPEAALVNKCFRIYNEFEILGESNLHSQMLRISLYFKDVEGVELLDFLHGWDFTNFREEDMQPFSTGKGSTIPSLCERAYLTYARVLFANMNSDDEAKREKAIDYASEFLPELEEVLEKMPRNVWLPYARAILMSKMGKAARVQMELIHVLRERSTEFWAWASLAESYLIAGRENEAMACYSKAFLLPSQSELAVQVRESFAALLLKGNFNTEAKTEIETVILARTKKDAKVSKQIQKWKNLEWYADMRTPFNNKMLYIRYAGRADQLLWADLAESVAVITHVDKERAIFFFAVDKKIGGKHKLKKPFERVQIGDIWALKIREADMSAMGKDGEKITVRGWGVVGGRPEKEKIPDEICRRLSERIQIPFGRDFGFMKPSNVYVGADLVKKAGLIDGQALTGIALLSFNKAKNEWGWKMISVDQD
ncbi:MAG: hypothetical protein RL757_224 [Bacteroidota bacterium]|jgi:tetratricopeptide (TPR) repeat protein